MGDTFRKSMSWMHTWVGLFVGWVAFVLFFAGSISVFWTELNAWARPSIHGLAAISRAKTLETGEAWLRTHAPDSRQWRIVLPSDRYPGLAVYWRDREGKSQQAVIDPVSGRQDVLQTNGGSFFVRLHYRLHLDRKDLPVGIWTVGAVGLAMLVLCISGVVIHVRIFKDLFVFRPKSSAQRRWLDAHNVLGVLPLPFHLMIAYTGLVALYYIWMPAGIDALYKGSESAFRTDATSLQYREIDDKIPPGAKAHGFPLTTLVARTEARFGAESAAYLYVRDPGRANAVVEVWRRRDYAIRQQVDRVAFDGVTGKTLRVLTRRSQALELQSFLTGLHFVEFGGSVLRWIYFVAGMMGAALIATGAVLFTIKRKAKAVSDQALAWYALAGRLNVAVIAGLPFSCAVYLCGVRLLPSALTDRLWWEIFVFASAWLVALVHAGIRPEEHLWREQLSGGALVFALVPALGMAFPQVSLLSTLASGDMATASVDLTCVAGALLLAFLAARKTAQPTQQGVSRRKVMA